MSAVIGLGMVALPTGLLASGFSERLHERRRELEGEVDRIPRRGVISAEEGGRLKGIRDRLGLTDHQAAEITRRWRIATTLCNARTAGDLPADHAPGDPGAGRHAE